MSENDLPKEEKLVTEDEFKKEVKKHLLVMEYNKRRIDNFTVFKKLLIITAPFAVGYLIYGYCLYKNIYFDGYLFFMIGIIPFLVSLIFNLLILVWSRGRIIDISLALLHLLDYVIRNEDKVVWTSGVPVNLDDIMKMGEESLERKDDGEHRSDSGIHRTVKSSLWRRQCIRGYTPCVDRYEQSSQRHF